MINTEVMRVSMRGNGITKTFQFPFRLNKASDLLVQIYDGTTLAEVTNYAIEPAEGKYPSTGGTVIYPNAGATPAIGSDVTIIISRNIAIIQDDEYSRNDTLSVINLEKTYDSNVQRIQQIKDLADRSVKVPIFSDADVTLPAPEAGKGFYWDETGTKLVNGMNPQEATDRAETAAARAETAEAEAQSHVDTVIDAQNKAQEYAEKAQTAQVNAETAEGEAKQAATDAYASSVSARENADRAQTYLDTVEADADRAETAAEGAKASEIAAKDSENVAIIHAKNAALSEAAAGISESNAKVSASNASTSENKASSSATNAATSATNAAISAVNAAASAKEAKDATERITKAMVYKGSVATYADLPTDADVGYMYNVQTADTPHGIKAGDNVVWSGSDWDNVGGKVDLSDYALIADQQKDIVSATVSNATVTLIARDGTKTALTVDNVVNATNASEATHATSADTATKATSSDTATKATQDADGNIISSTYVKSANLATVATSGAYSDLSGTPTLATVATTGKYSDLSGLPSIPHAVEVGDDGTSDDLQLWCLHNDDHLYASHSTEGGTSNPVYLYQGRITACDMSIYATKTEVNAKAPTVSPTFTGTVTAETVTVTSALNIPGGKVWIE